MAFGRKSNPQGASSSRQNRTARQSSHREQSRSLSSSNASSSLKSQRQRRADGSTRQRGAIKDAAQRGRGKQGTPRKRTQTPYNQTQATIKLIVAVLVAVALAVVLVINLPIFTVKRIVAAPTPHVTQEEIGQLLGVPTGTPLFKVNTDEAKKRLKANPWVENVSVSRQIPDTLSVHITERMPAGVVIARGGEEAWYISADGVWLEKLNLTGVIGVIADPKVGADTDLTNSSEKDVTTSRNSSQGTDKKGSSSESKDSKKGSSNDKDSEQNDKSAQDEKSDLSEAEQLLAQAQTISSQAQARAQDEHLLLIYDIDPSIVPEPGKTVEDSGLSSGLWYLRSFNSGLKERIVKMTAPNKSSISIQLAEGVLIALGDPASKEDIELKETVILSLLKLHEGSITYINVRVPSKPAYRGVETSKTTK